MKYLVLGNWKSNGTMDMVQAFRTLFEQYRPETPSGFYRGLCPPVHLLGQIEAMKDAWLGAQNVSAFGEGAFTGEITAKMLKTTVCQFCLVGHSERRKLFHETEEHTSAKMARLFEAGILPVLCIGETIEERNAGALDAILKRQLSPLADLARDARLVIAYEPVWAIGTGVAAQPEDVADAHERIRGLLRTWGLDSAPILYGGSVKPGNAAALATIENVDGFLIGGASLDPDDFKAILEGFLAAKSGSDS